MINVAPEPNNESLFNNINRINELDMYETFSKGDRLEKICPDCNGEAKCHDIKSAKECMDKL